MDRLIVLEAGRIVEEGAYGELLRLGGHYEKLWRHQSGGFLAEDVLRVETAIAEIPARDLEDETVSKVAR